MTAEHASARVAVIGAGYAGMAAAVSLARTKPGTANIRVTVFESAKVAGGRARRIEYQGHTLDNGQHILIGAYTSLLGLMQEVGTRAGAIRRVPLTMDMHPGFRMAAPALPAPLHLAWALLTAKGMSWSDRLASTRLSRLAQKGSLPTGLEGKTVKDLLVATRQPATVVEALWLPLCIAALNTPIDQACARVFIQVLHDALFLRREYSDFVLPNVDLTALFPQPASDWLTANGQEVRLLTKVSSVGRNGRGFTISSGGSKEEFDAVICATGPHQLKDLHTEDDVQLGNALRPAHCESYEPICTIYLSYPGAVPLRSVMQGRRTGMVQWFFDRSGLGGPVGLVAAVVSTSGPHTAMSQEGLAARAHAELCEITGPLPTPVWHKVIAEQFATFACTPGVPRPSQQTAIPGLALAGDYTDGPYPATLEGAVRSGEMAATHIRQYLEDEHRAAH